MPQPVPARLAPTALEVRERTKLLVECLLEYDTNTDDTESLELYVLRVKELHTLTSYLAKLALPHPPRRRPTKKKRRTWPEYRAEKEADQLFHKMFRLNSEQFDQLFALIKDKLSKDTSKCAKLPTAPSRCSSCRI